MTVWKGDPHLPIQNEQEENLYCVWNTTNFGSPSNSHWVTLTNTQLRKQEAFKTIQAGGMKIWVEADAMETGRKTYEYMT